MPDEPDPPRKYYQLKPRAFETVNDIPSMEASAGLPAAPPVSSAASPAVAAAAPPAARIEVREIYRQAGTPGPVLMPPPAPEKRNEVHDILQDNLARANAAGLNTLKPMPKRRSRRRRDYFLVLIPLNGFFGFAAFGPFSNVGMMAYGVAGMIIGTLGLTWILFFVMDDY